MVKRTNPGSLQGLTNYFSNLSLHRKLLVVLGFNFLAFLLTTLLVSSLVVSMSKNQALVFTRELPACKSLEALSIHAERLQLDVQMLILLEDPTGRDKLTEQLTETISETQRILDELKHVLKGDLYLLRRLDTVDTKLAKFKKRIETVLIPMAMEKQSLSAKLTLLKKERSNLEEIHELALGLDSLAEEVALDRLTKTQKRSADTITTIWLLYSTILSITAWLSIVLARVTVRPLQRLTQAARDIAVNEQLPNTFDTNRKDEVGVLQRSFLYMIESLRERSKERDRALNELARSNAELQQFAYIAAHDLKEPLRTVTNYLTLLSQRLDGALDEKGHKYMSKVLVAADRQQMLITELLEYARLGNKSFAPAPVDMNKLTKQVLEDLKVTIQETGAEIDFTDLPQVQADENQMYKLILNLVQNAIKFRGNRAPHISIDFSEDESNWTFRIRDRGIGFDMSFRDKIFIIFQRLHSRDEYPGTGMGLAVCKRIVERHGGIIDVESAPGEGSEFRFSIPKRQNRIGEQEVGELPQNRDVSTTTFCDDTLSKP